MHYILALLFSLSCVSAQNNCLNAALAWESMGGNPFDTPNRIPRACCGYNGIQCDWTFEEFSLRRRRITVIIWDRKGLSSTISDHLYQLGAMKNL